MYHVVFCDLYPDLYTKDNLKCILMLISDSINKNTEITIAVPENSSRDALMQTNN